MNRALHFETSSQSSWKPIIPTAEGIFRQNYENSGLYSEFESTQSPMAASPVSSSIISNDIAAVGELAGKLGSEFSPAAMTAALPPYAGTNPPLNSSISKPNLPIMNHFVEEYLSETQNLMSVNPSLPFFPDDPGFADRAAKFSCFGHWSFNDRSSHLGLNSSKPEIPVESRVFPVTRTGKVHRVSSSPALKTDRPLDSDETNMNLSRISCSAANSNEESSVSEKIPTAEYGLKIRKVSNSRKRKGSSSKGVRSNTEKKEEDKFDELKKLKKTEHENGGKMEDQSKQVDPPKDYIHVRARRGQATDSHSLAERVRREKISERMKLLQNLVPNCNKVTGKALMLDEIINYVQSLQRQVEFLSMKLATFNPSLHFDTNDLTSQNVNQSNGNLSNQTSTLYLQNRQLDFGGSAPVTQPVNAFAEPFPHGFGQDDLESIVRMGFGDNLDLDTPFLRTTHDQPFMKVELSPQVSTYMQKKDKSSMVHQQY